MLPVVTGRFLFSQAPALLLPMWKQGQLQPGRLQAGHSDPAQEGVRGPPPLDLIFGQWVGRSLLLPTLSPSLSSPKRKVRHTWFWTSWEPRRSAPRGDS